MRILVIEDDRDTAKLVSQSLKLMVMTWTALVMANRVSSWRQSAEFDVLVIDRMLPGLDGLSIVQSIRGPNSIPLSFS